MSIGNLETRMSEYFLHSLKEQRSRRPIPHNGSPLLYLKYWGLDYPYLQGVEQQKRWLPAVVDSGPSI